VLHWLGRVFVFRTYARRLGSATRVRLFWAIECDGCTCHTPVCYTGLENPQTFRGIADLFAYSMEP